MPKFVSPSGRQYTQSSVLGAGTFGTIIVCKDSEHDQDCIMKRVRLARQTAQERLASVQELAVMQQLSHSNLIRGIDGWLENKHTTCLVMESCKGGDLATLLEGMRTKNTTMDEQDVHMMIVQLAAVVSYLHSINVLHRDIKSSNIFIGDNQQLKLADLGLCRQLSDSEERPRTTAGTLNYMAPELTKEESYSKPADIWALGCVFYEICALKPAFHAFKTDGIVKKIQTGKAPALPAEYSQPLRRLVRTMLYTDESKRPSAEEILQMTFLQDARESVEAMFGPIAVTSERPLGPSFLPENIPAEWLNLMRKFQADHKAYENIGASDQGSKQSPSVTASTAAAKSRKAPVERRTSKSSDVSKTPILKRESSSVAQNSTIVANAKDSANSRVMETILQQTTVTGASAGAAVTKTGGDRDTMQILDDSMNDCLTRLEPGVAEELIQAAEFSATVGSAQGSVQHLDLPVAGSVTSVLLECSAGCDLNTAGSGDSCSASKAQGDCFKVQCARSCGSAKGTGGRRSLTSGNSSKNTSAATRISSKNLGPAWKGARSQGSESDRTSVRIRSVNRKLSECRIKECSSGVATTSLETVSASLGSGDSQAPGALKSTGKARGHRNPHKVLPSTDQKQRVEIMPKMTQKKL